MTPIGQFSCKKKDVPVNVWHLFIFNIYQYIIVHNQLTNVCMSFNVSIFTTQLQNEYLHRDRFC